MSRVSKWIQKYAPKKELCQICKKILDVPGDPASRNCGGDCLECMAKMGDPDCMKTMFELTGEKIHNV